MDIIIAATKSCHHRPILSRELTRWGVNYRVMYFEDHPELTEKYGFQTSPLVIVNEEVVSVGMPDLTQLKNLLAKTEEDQDRD